ncbi:MAG: phage late control D family protein [Rhodoferax sp.]
MKPDFQVVADKEDITALLRDRLISIRTTDKPGLEADECEIHIDDRDGKVAFPKKGATLEISLGYLGEKLTFLGRYTVDEIEVSGPPQSIVIRGKPANIAATMKSQRRHAWERVTLSGIVSDIARRNKLQPLCQVVADVPRADQINESDMHFITRLAKQHGATATVKDGKLIVAKRGDGKSGGGKPLPEISLHRDDLASYTFTFPDRALYGQVQANWHDKATGKQEVVLLENPSAPAGVAAPRHTARHTYPTKEAADAAARAQLAALNRATMTGRIELDRGRADIGAEKWVKFEGIKMDVNGTYLIESVEQRFSKEAWITSFAISAGNGGKGKVGREKKPTSIKVLKLAEPATK